MVTVTTGHGLYGEEPWLKRRLTLCPGEVDVWMVVVEQVLGRDLLAQYYGILSDEEHQRHKKYVFEKDRRRYLITRALVRYVLSRYVPVPPAEWRFLPTAFGRPMVANRHPGVVNLTFNISHSDQVVLLGLTSNVRLGVDVEDLRREVPVDIADHFFSSKEVQQLRALQSKLQARHFLDLWTLKESFVKACGAGLSIPLDKFGFELSSGKQLQAYFDAELNTPPVNWAFLQWQPSADSIAALCVESQADIATTVRVRRTVPFISEQSIDVDVLRTSWPWLQGIALRY